MAEKIVVTIDPDLEDLIPGFLDNRQKDIAKLREALAGADYESIRSIGHSMKGAGGGYGFDTITDIGAAIEQGALAKQDEAIESGIAELVDYLERVEVTFVD